MGGGWQRLRRLLHPRPGRFRQVSLAERFAHFRAVGAANDAFLESLAALRSGGDGDLRGMGVVASAYESLSSPVHAMVGALQQLSGGRYQRLLHRYEEIDRELAQAVLRERPLEYGALVAWPDEPEARRSEVVGPKAARLADLVAAGLEEVPSFFTVTVHGYRLFMQASGLEDLVHSELWTADQEDEVALQAACGRIRTAILEATPPPALAEAIEDGVRRLRRAGLAGPGFAVRSSAVVEDGEFSFAGQFDSLLNVRDDQVVAAYKLVLASKYRFETVRYASDRGFLDDDVAMPVLLMGMVEPAASGVAYSRDPARDGHAVVTAVRGLGQPVVEGTVIPDRFAVALEPRLQVVGVDLAPRDSLVACAPGGGVRTEPLPVGDQGAALKPESACRVARAAVNLEQLFGGPQDVEWAVDHSGSLLVLQSRPLRIVGQVEGGEAVLGLDAYRILLRHARVASAGCGCGPVYRVPRVAAVGEVPEGAVLVVPNPVPSLAALVGRVAAIVAEAGSPTGHMATVAREAGLPFLVGAEGALDLLEDGGLVTVDAGAGLVYEGRVPELLGSPRSRGAADGGRNPVREATAALLDRAGRLTLTDPDSSEFTPQGCVTLHDVARFVHQKSMQEMFAVEGLSARERRQARRLVWKLPMDVLVLDLGGGLAREAERRVRVNQLTSVPLAALLEGLSDPRLRWAGPVGFDLKGFVSVVARSAADDQRFGEPSYALCARDFAHFGSRLAYHFVTVESVCGTSINENFVRFLYHGGAAEAQRREWRAHFLAAVLEYHGFTVKQVGDRVEAMLAKRAAPALEDSLVMVGRLMVASRHLDMVMDSHDTAHAYAAAFLAGDFAFEFARSVGS